MSKTVELQWIRRDDGVQWLIAPAPFPERPQDGPPAWAHVFRHILGNFRQKRKLESEMLIEFNPLHLGGNQHVSPNAKSWIPTVGMGVRRHKDPPRMMTMEDTDDFDPAAPFPFLSHPLCRVTRESKKDHCWDTMIGYGATVVMLSSMNTPAIAAAMKNSLLPLVKEPVFRASAEYWLLVDPDAMSRSRQELDVWLGGVQLYFRECLEQRCAMLLALEPLDPWLAPFRPQPDAQNRSLVRLTLDGLEAAPPLGSVLTKPDEFNF